MSVDPARESAVWVGVELDGPGSTRRTAPTEVRVFGSQRAARDWEHSVPLSVTSPPRFVYERRVEA